MLYSIVICDLVYKLESAKDIFQDETAINILEEISDMQQSNPSSPTRESSLIDKVKDRTNLFSI
jgi:hypothetical protein